MLNKIKLYIGYWLIMLSFYRYRKIFEYEWNTLKEAFKVISHPDDYNDYDVASNHILFVTTNATLRTKVDMKKKMEEREDVSYIAPCEDVVVELPFMVKRVMRGRRPSNELCKQCMRYEYCNEYHLTIGENYKPACVNVREDNTCIIDEDNL